MTILVRIFALLLALSASACSAAPTEREFAEEMLARFKKASPQGEMKLKADEPLVIQIKGAAGWEEASINLHRIWGFCQNNSAKDCEVVKAEFVQKIDSIKKPETGKRAALRVIVRDSQYMDYVLQTFSDKGKLPIYRQIGEGLFAILAFDGKDAIGLANADGLKDAGVTGADAWPLAFAQTKAVLPELPVAKIGKREPVAFQDYEYLASLLADIDTWRAVASKAGPDLAVSVVSDSFVFVFSMPDGVKLNEFKRTVEEDCRAQPRCVSPFVYRFRDGQWRIAR